MERIFALSPVPILVLTPALTVLEASTGYLKIASIRRDQCVGASLDDALGDRLGQIFDQETIHNGVSEALARRIPYLSEIVGPLEEFYYRTRTTPVYEAADKLVYILLEFVDSSTEHARQTSLLKQLRACETYRLLVNTVKDYAIFMLDTGGHIVTWNKGARLLKGYTAEEIIGKHFSIFYAKEDRVAGKPERELADAIRVGEVEDEGWRYRKDGSRFWANVIITPIYDGDEHVGFTKVTRDLTQRKAEEARVIAEYEKASEMKNQFLANMSHEIRSPMQGMLGALGLLLDTPLTSEQRELAGIVEESGKVLLHVM
jgi:osomolarity two-component system, sensor histidine kinase TcsA